MGTLRRYDCCRAHFSYKTLRACCNAAFTLHKTGKTALIKAWPGKLSLLLLWLPPKRFAMFCLQSLASQGSCATLSSVSFLFRSLLCPLSFLVASCRFLCPPGASWRLLAPPGASWRFLALPGASWRLLALLSASRRFRGSWRLPARHLSARGIVRSRGAMQMRWLHVVGREVWDRVMAIRLYWPDTTPPR